MAQRMADLDRLERAVRKHSDELVAACSADFGRRAPHETLAADVHDQPRRDQARAASTCAAGCSPQRRAVNLSFLPARGELRYAPLGVVGIVAPWNYPFQLALVPLANAIAAGNRVMIKPSEHTPAGAARCWLRMLGEVFTADEVVVVQGDARRSARHSPRLPFDHLLFTGSTAVGRQVMAAAAPNLTPVTLELGGKSPGADRAGLSDRTRGRPHRLRQVLQRRPDLRGAGLRAGAAGAARCLRRGLHGQPSSAVIRPWPTTPTTRPSSTRARPPACATGWTTPASAASR